MNDLIARLRAVHKIRRDATDLGAAIRLCYDAADALEQLQRERDEAREYAALVRAREKSAEDFRIKEHDRAEAATTRANTLDKMFDEMRKRAEAAEAELAQMLAVQREQEQVVFSAGEIVCRNGVAHERETGCLYCRCERAEAELARVKKDAERYRWLQREIDMGRLSAVHPKVMDALYDEDGNALDAEIDAAMQGGK